MISAINFTGREGLLGQSIKAKQGYGNKMLDRYVNEGTIFPREEVLAAEKMVRRATLPSQEVQRHEFLSQTEPLGKIESAPSSGYISDSMPHGMLIDIKA